MDAATAAARVLGRRDPDIARIADAVDGSFALLHALRAQVVAGNSAKVADVKYTEPSHMVRELNRLQEIPRL